MFPSRGGAHTRPAELFAGQYAVDGALPWGGLATYYRAAADGTPLILCVLPMDVGRSVQAEAAFSELAQRLGAARSRCLPRILDAGVIDGVPYLAFHEFRGALLSDLLRTRPIASLDVLRIATNVLDALDSAHTRGLVHGDLTPQNVVVARDPHGKLVARVAGMGILPLLRENPEASAHAAHTGSGQHAVSYMAPELFGGGMCEPSADIYAVGALLHHMVTGAPPIGWESGEGFDDLPALPDVIARAMAKHPEHRYPNAASMRTALEWVEVESAKRNPSTQDIAPWMETSRIGSIPVAALSSSNPPAHVSSSHPAGKILSTSGARRLPATPVVIEEPGTPATRSWVQILLLLLLLGALVLSGYWVNALRTASSTTGDAAAEVDDAP